MRAIETLAQFLGIKVSGAEISPEAASVAESLATRSAAIYTAVSYIAGAVSQCEVVVRRDGKRVADELSYALNVSPNPNQSGSPFLYSLVERYFYDGEALIVKPKPSRNHLFVADSFTRDENPLGEDRFRSVSISNGKTSETLSKTFKASDVCYLTQGNKQARQAVNLLYSDMGSVLDYAMNSFKGAKSDRWTFTRNSRPGGTPEQERERREALQDSLRKFISSPNSVLPITPDQKLERIAANNQASTAAEIIELRKDIYDATAAAFKLPPSMLYGNMTNISDIMEQFLTFAVDPLAEEIGDELSRKFFTYEDYLSGCSVSLDTTGIQHVELFGVAPDADKLISSGMCSIDEVRRRAGLEPVGDEFSATHWMTKNYEPSDVALDRDDAQRG